MSNVMRQLPLTEMLQVPRVAFELMNLPAGRPGNRVHIGGYNERRENITQPPYEVGAQFAAVVVFDQTQKPSMRNAPNYHRWSVR